MEFKLDSPKQNLVIQRYSADTITINHHDYTHSLILNATTLIDNWAPQTLADLTAESFDPIMALKPTILILGVGEKHQFPNPGLLQRLYQQRIGVEVMTTAAACRTFNVLVAEGRNVVAALLKG